MSNLFQNIQQLHQQILHLQHNKQTLNQRSQEMQSLNKQLQEMIEINQKKDKQLKQTKNQLADCRFELKKLQQDIASERTQIEIDRIKFLKTYEQKNKQQKEKIEHQNQDWINRFDLRNQQFKEEIIRIEATRSNQAQKQIQKYKHKMDTELFAIKQENNKTINKLQTQIVTIQQQFKIQKQQLERQLQLKLVEEIKNVKQKTKNDILKKQRQYEIKLLMVQNQRKIQVSEHQNTKKQFVNIKDNLYQQIYQLTQYKDNLEVSVKQFKQLIEEKTKKIKFLDIEIKQLQVKHDHKIKTFMQNSKKNLESVQAKSSGDKQQILKNQLIYIQTMEHKIQILEEKYLDIMNQYKKQLTVMQQYYSQRPSKQQDTELIKILKQEVQNKQNKIQELQHQLKWFRLEVNNKDDMYKKFFAKKSLHQNQLKSLTNHNQTYYVRSRSKGEKEQKQYKVQREGRTLMLKRRCEHISRTQSHSIIRPLSSYKF